jgi:hypothetical protein
VREATDLEWPLHVFSLSHVALPFPPDDPVYGAGPPPKDGRIYRGQPELLRERGFLTVPPMVLMRLRYNPFAPYVERRIEAFLE